MDDSKLPLGTEDGADDQDGQNGGETPIEIDYKKKFAESTRQEQIRSAQLKAAEERLGKLVNVDKITEDELRKEFDNWDDLSDEMKRIYARSVTTERRLNKALLMLDEATSEKRLSSELSIVFREYPEIKEREDEFREFINRDKYRGSPMDLLAQAFLHQSGGTKKIIKNKPDGLEDVRSNQSVKSITPPKSKKQFSPQFLDLAKRAGLKDEDLNKFTN